MIGNLKTLGIALGAVLAIGAMAASAASATDLFTTSVEPAVVTGANENTNVLRITKADGGAAADVKCATMKFSKTFTSSTAKEIETFPTYFGTSMKPNNEKCETSIGDAIVDMNGCGYDLTGQTTQKDPADLTGRNDAVISVTCPLGKEIQITGPASCTISIPQQTPTEGGVIYTFGEEEIPAESGKKVKDVTITATITGITFTSTPMCQLANIPKEGNNSDYNGTLIATCWEDKGGGAKPDEFIEGAACNLTSS